MSSLRRVRRVRFVAVKLHDLSIAMMTKRTCETCGKLSYSQSILCQIICGKFTKSPKPSRPSRTPPQSFQLATDRRRGWSTDTLF